MPKNKGRNAFFFFMADWRKRMEAQGYSFPNGFRDVQQDPDCNEEWRSLTKQEKGPYEAMAKNDKVSSQIAAKGKRTTLGESISMLEQKQKEAEMFIKNMQENIKVIINSAVNLNFVPQLKFCFVHVNWFFSKIVNNTNEYFPAEYAFGIFSLEKGIEDVHHVIVSAQIPLGYRREAIEISQNSHKIPIEYTGGETDFAVMYDKLVNFLESRKVVDQYPYLYTTRDCIQVVRSFMGKLSNAAQQDREQFKIYELESLFTHLAKEAYKKRNDRVIEHIPVYAETMFTRFTYIFDKGFECYFHKYVDGGTEWCSKCKLQHWTWTLCDEFCEPFGIIMKPGIHCTLKNSEADLSSMASLINNIKINDAPSTSVPSDMLSMTGVSEQHRLKVSSRTYEENLRRRNESKPVEVIDYSKMSRESASKPIGEPANKFNEFEAAAAKPVEEKKYGSKYLNEMPLRPPNINPFTSTEDFLVNDDENFPPIGGRGVALRSRIQNARKVPLGKGQGHA
ncbi:PREDICTED: protein maelstrom 2-like [Vollenhovia emeryi]|uniref:protein maelstrom 2-like n=1 Tax=Vollenhovia emeryi TaxID=411798 RepID=UPI0005F58E1D|nr:PREDICTED: protein maelstrom 2-like [Vollenhovia emeryi]